MKMKKLLAVALAVIMAVSSMVTCVVASAAEPVGTITVGTAEVKVGDTTATVDVTIDFTKEITAPHDLFTLTAQEGFTLTAVEKKDVVYTTLPEGSAGVTIDAEDGTDLAAGKILLESPVDTKAPVVTKIVLTATYAIAETVAAGEYAITVDSEIADITETDLTLTEADGKITVVVPHVCTPAEAVKENEVPATCYATGSYDSVVYCSDEGCKKELSRTPVTVEKIAHTPAEAVVENNVDATCYAEGSYDSVVYCAVAECKHEISRTPVTVEKIAHTPAAPVEENRVEAKPGVAGSYDSVVYCSVEACKAEISRTTNEIPALPEIVDCEGNHTYTSVKENVTATTFDSVTYCSACRLEIARYTIDIPQGAVLDENIAPSGHTTSVGETVGIGFRAKLSTLPAADAYKLYVVRYKNAGSYMFGTTSETLDQAGKSAAQDFVAFKTYYGIELYSFTVPVTYMILCYDDNGNVIAYSNPFTTTVEDICENYHDLSSTGAAAKTLHADLINLAAATQKYFVSRNPNSDYAKKLVLPSFDSAYASDEISGPLANFNSTSGIELTVTTAIGQNPYFNIRFSGNIANKANYSMKVSFYNKIKKETIVTEIDGSTFKGNATTINGTFEALPLYAGDADVTIELYENGNDKPIGVRHFSLDTHIGTYLSDNAGSTNATTVLLMNIWDAAAKYGQAHRALRNIPYVPVV